MVASAVFYIISWWLIIPEFVPINDISALEN
jgi:hypothetical protein